MSDLLTSGWHRANDELKQVTEENARLKESFQSACIAYAEFTGSCPEDMNDVYMDCENVCDNNAAKCWEKYFLGDGE